MHDPGDLAFPLSDPRCSDPRVTGGKAAELGRLSREGFPVPEAWVLPVSVFADYFPAADPAQKPSPPTLDPALERQLGAICTALCTQADDRLAVRSSALGEDGASASHAGQHETYYYVGAATIGKAVTDCWLSLWSERARAYRAAHPGQTEGFGMAVIIQRMVQSDRSGVCFSEDPTGIRPGTSLLESTWGLGAALVDGRVSPDRFWLGSDGTLVDSKISRKRLKVGEHLEDPSQSRLEPVPLNQQARPTLSAIEITQIVDISRRIAVSRGTPQDVEWAIAGDELFILQSRPITAIGPAPPPLVEGRRVLFKPIAENFSEPLTPMSVDLYRRVIPPFGHFIAGRYYVNVDLMEKLLPWRLDDTVLTDLLLLRGDPPEADVSIARLGRMLGLLTLGYLAAGVTWHRTARMSLDGLSAFATRCQAILADQSLDPLQALRRAILNDHPFRPIGEFAVQANLCSIRYFLLTALLKKLLEKWAPAFDQGLLVTLCSGGPEMLSQQMVEGVQELAKLAGADPGLRDDMRADGADLQAVVARLEDNHPFPAALSRFMRRFGHRAVREVELAAPRWREENTTVLAMVRNYLTRIPADDAEAQVDTRGLLLAARDELHQSLSQPWQRRVADWLIARIRFYVTLRENTRYYHTMGMAVTRDKLKQLELQLIQEGRLHCEDDVFFLEYPEALALVAGTLDWRDVEERIRDRRLAYQRRCLEPAAEAFNLEVRAPQPGPDASVLTGDCACPGVATGVARIIRDPTVAADLNVGEILVAPYTDPAWTPLFPGAAAVIVEVGSYLSHAGTVAREYRIPCLVDVQDCTRRIRTGQTLRVNATEGWVEIVP